MTQTPLPGGSSTDLSAKLLPELRSIGVQMGIKGARQMRKADLVGAIRAGGWPEDSTRPAARSTRPAREVAAPAVASPAEGPTSEPATPEGATRGRRRAARSERPASGRPTTDGPSSDRPDVDRSTVERRRAPRSQREDTEQSVAALLEAAAPAHEAGASRGQNTRADAARASDSDSTDSGQAARDRRDGRSRRQRGARPTTQDPDRRRPAGTEEVSDVSDEVGARLDALAGRAHDARARGERVDTESSARHGEEQREEDLDLSRREDDEFGGRRSRRRRQRDRQGRRNKRGNDRFGSDTEPNVREDDVLVPCSGILDIRDQYAFVRTSGYLPGANDAYVSMSTVRKYGLRKGDVIVGQMRAHREGERREKFAPLARVETVNGADPELMKQRPDFSKLTPLYPQERLRLETDPKNMTGRIIDLVSPIGKGQRGLIVSPPKAGKTMIMQSIANSITTNNPEVHLMVVLVDERPEEVTDFQRTVSGEVIASTFDRPADDHTQVAELAIERAKRLVELGKDVVILLDGITRLGRAYNLAAPASGRILSGGVDSAALYPPKKFFGAARNIENGGSLTILATALVETGSKMDEVIFEEFKGTGNMELRLRREFANKRLFPAIDVDASSTRREELLLSREETAIMWKLRRVLSGLDDSQALEMVLSKLRKTQTNVEFLYTISKTSPASE
ncbi:transcription termination factor Rho [Acidipropionibacterium timonense]|uniref:transcription termination factor Rho n=1 Tax=Acidipropionibacterium timonense TaxID=2161818 RepID=UPI001031B118|nr:transcription termination factor Rho [Acidipropionibacterium timonense]